ncbi:GNAT family N-acetyltransferase [Kutzneria sp. CA-103260]|uniref:GNAT family N-acetyltransferase n=1 Tax=Kutzneria sp. CA-103260 TaxID=2802641 RepID=UPI001BEE3506|nr:GNAT family N-acetyltransferase [Kutzneria sp. CA-103260]QUQ66142.1 N-acetyltransferase GCN5 [Kutzneria sp. CA-103260]
MIEARPWTDPAGVHLRAKQRAEVLERYGGVDTEPGVHPSADDIAVFLIAFDDAGMPLGCGALRQLDVTSAEVKRMYVEPQARGTGVATAVLRALEQAAVDRGWTTVRLETGAAQPDAIRFYEREGYRPIPNYGDYIGFELSLCYERVLSSGAPADAR